MQHLLKILFFLGNIAILFEIVGIAAEKSTVFPMLTFNLIMLVGNAGAILAFQSVSCQ